MEDVKDLIPLDCSRCSDDRCPIAIFCARSRQKTIDYKKGQKNILMTDFKGAEKVGLCDYFLNIEYLKKHN